MAILLSVNGRRSEHGVGCSDRFFTWSRDRHLLTWVAKQHNGRERLSQRYWMLGKSHLRKEKCDGETVVGVVIFLVFVKYTEVLGWVRGRANYTHSAKQCDRHPLHRMVAGKVKFLGLVIYWYMYNAHKVALQLYAGVSISYLRRERSRYKDLVNCSLIGVIVPSIPIWKSIRV